MRGRSYLPGITNDVVNVFSLRTLKTAAATALQTAAQAFLTGLLTDAGQHLALHVLSRSLGVATPVIDGRANLGIVEQRRRYERVAHH